MPEISDLLHEAARGTQLGLDLDRVTRRADALRRREQAAVSTGAAFAALLVAVPLLLHGGGSQRDEVRLVPGPTLSAEPTPEFTATPGATPSAVSTRGGDQPRVQATASAEPSVEPAPPASPPSPSASSTAEASQFPPASGCEVSTTGLGASERRTCRFTATEWGGWRMTRSGAGVGYVNNTEALVTIVHDGQTTQFDGNGPVNCGSDVIEPGDLVTVTVKQTDVGNFDFTLGAGVDYHC